MPPEAELEDLAMHVSLTSDLEWNLHASMFASNEPEHDFACTVHTDTDSYREGSEVNSFKFFNCYRSLEVMDYGWLDF